MPNILKYNGELYAKIIDSDSEGVEIVENSTIENPAQEHGVSESVSEILEKIERLQHELTTEIEKLKSIQTHKDSILLSDSLDLSDERKLEYIGNEIDHYIITKWKNSFPHSQIILKNSNFQINTHHSDDFDMNKERLLSAFITKEIHKEFPNARFKIDFKLKEIVVKGSISV